MLGALLVGATIKGVRLDPESSMALAAAVWLVAKDWRDVLPSTRDLSAWSPWFHPRFHPLRAARRAAWLPAVAALVGGAIGAANVLAVVNPDLGWHRERLLGAEPISAIPIFHALVLPAGAALIVAALYLKRRRHRAWQASFGLLLALGAFNLFKGFDLEAAAVAWAGAAALWWGRGAFSVQHARGSLGSCLWKVPGLGLGVAVLAYAVVWATAANEPTAPAIARETWDLLTWSRGPLPYADDRAWVPFGVGLIGLGALVFAAHLVFRPLGLRRDAPVPALRAAATALVRAHGSDTLSFFKLRQDTGCFFSRGGRAFVGYTVESNVLVVSGDPVGPPEALEPLVAELCAFAELRGLTIGVVGASAELLPLYARAGLRPLYIGDEAIVETARFSLEGRAVRKVRQSVGRLTRAGFSTELVAVAELGETVVRELEAVSAAWLRGAPERGFSMAMDTLRGPHLADSVVLLARDGGGAVRGFLHFVPAYGRPAMSLSCMRWDRAAPNGLNEYLVVRAIQLLGERGIEELSLNFAAFARVLHQPSCRLERLLARVLAVGNRYFQIESLYRFNAKFSPRWTPRYLVYESVLALPRTGLAVMWAEGQLPKPRLPALVRHRLFRRRTEAEPHPSPAAF